MTSSSIFDQGVLTGSGVDTIYEPTGTAAARITFVNYSVSTVDLELFVNGSGDTNRVAYVNDLATQERAVVTVTLGAGDDFRAEASAATSIAYTIEEVLK